MFFGLHTAINAAASLNLPGKIGYGFVAAAVILTASVALVPDKSIKGVARVMMGVAALALFTLGWVGISGEVFTPSPEMAIDAPSTKTEQLTGKPQTVFITVADGK